MAYQRSQNCPKNVSQDIILDQRSVLNISEHPVRSADADITFRSSDDVLFRVHKTNLQACTEGFSPPEASDSGEVVELTETASILEVLFQFIYPMPQPRLESFSSTEIASLAEAAEKYQVHPAMGACRIYMKYA